MAGMLPGVESARRRRFHQGGGSTNSLTRRSTFCLYTTGFEPQLSSTNYLLQQRRSLSKGSHGGELGDVAREAKERLDERLRAKRCTEIKRLWHTSTGNASSGEQLGMAFTSGNMQREVFSSKKSLRKFSWGKLGWKASEQMECAVCLENFKNGEILLHLPCAHRFHWNCVMQWIESSSHCPCCRTPVPS